MLDPAEYASIKAELATMVLRLRELPLHDFRVDTAKTVPNPWSSPEWKLIEAMEGATWHCARIPQGWLECAAKGGEV